MSFIHRGFSRRNFLQLMGVTASAAALTACGVGNAQGFSQPDGDTPAEYADRLRVVFWSNFTGNNGEHLGKLIDRFNESQSDIYCEVQQFDGYDGLDQKLVASLQARESPDLTILSDVAWNRYFLNESLEPLDGYFGGDFTPEIYQPAFIEEGQINGNTWWVPFARSTPLFYYNKEIFDLAGLPDRAPETYTEFREWGDVVTGMRYRNLDTKLRAITAGDDWYYSGQLWAFGGGISDGLDVIIDNEASLAAAQFDHDLIHTDQSCFYSQQAAEDFQAGMTATHLHSTGGLTGMIENSDFELGVGFLPREVDYGVPTGGSGLAIMRHAAPERKEAAFEVLKFLAREEQSAQWAVDTGYMPATVAAAESDTIQQLRRENPHYGVAIDQLQHASAPDHVRRYVSSAINDIRQGQERMYTETTPVETIWTEVARQLEAGTESIREPYERLVLGQ